MRYDDIILIIIMISVFIFGIALGLTIGIILPAFAQTTPIITVPNPQSGLNFLPQKAYVTTLTPEGLPVQIPVQQVQAQQQQSDGGINAIIPGLIASAVAYFAAKTQGDKKTKDNMAEIAHTKEVQKELARVTYDMNPAAAAEIKDAPLVKLETLNNDAADFAKKAAKA